MAPFSRLILWASCLSLAFPIPAFGVNLDDVFIVATGHNDDGSPKDGTCDPYRRDGGNGILDAMFEEMLEISSTAVKGLAEEPQVGTDNVRKLMQAFFGVNINDDDAHDEIITSRELEYRTELYCDSTFMIWYDMDHTPALDDEGQPMYKDAEKQVPLTVGEALDARQPVDGDQSGSEGEMQNGNDDFDHNDNWAYWLPSFNYYLPLDKAVYGTSGPFPSYADRPNFPTYCASEGHEAWTMSRFHRHIIVLCPKLFTGDGRDQVDLAPQPLKTVLDSMKTKSLTWYHEMFHVAFDPANGIERSPDARKWKAKTRKKQTKFGPAKTVPVANWPTLKNTWQETTENALGGVQCMYVALYDAAQPVGRLGDLFSLKNPESYAWFGLALYMSTEGSANQDWSTGACRPKQSPPQRVTVTIKDVIPRQGESTPEPDSSVSWWRGASGRL